MDAKIWVLLALINIVRSRDIVVGSNDSGHKIYDEKKQANPAIWRQIENVTIAANETEVISKIVITDLRAEKDGDARIVEGGEGQNNVTIELKSPTVLRGYEFHVEAYAIPDGHQKTAEQSSGSTESNVLKKSSEASTLQDNIGSTISLNKELQSPTQGTKTNDGSVRQNRDTENKDKSVEEVHNNTPSVPDTVNTNETSKIPLPETLTSTSKYDMKTEVSDQKYPTVNREVEQKPTYFHPRVHIYEVTEFPKSTESNIAATNSKVPVHENIYTRGVQAGINDKKNLQSNFQTDKLHTNIDEQDSKQLSEPVANTALPFARQDGKNKNLRHERDVSNPMVEKKGESKSLGVDDKANTDKTNILNNQAQEHNHKPVEYPGTIDVKSSSSNQGSDENHHDEHNITLTKNINKEQTRNNAFRGRHSYRRFENTANFGDRNIMSSTEINKISTPLPKGDESTQSEGKFNIYSQPNVIGRPSTTGIPDISGTIDKSGTTTEKLVSPDLQTKVEGANEAKRNTRDTTSINKKDKTESTMPPVLRSFSSSLKPEINTKDVLDKNVANTDPHGDLKEQDGNQSINAKSDKTTFLIHKEERNSHPSKIGIDISGASNTPSSTTNKHVGYKSTTEQQKTETPKASTTSQAYKISEDKERQTRDTSSVDQIKQEDKKISSTEKPVTAESKTKVLQKVRNHNEYKTFDLEGTITTPSAIANDKIIKDEGAKKHDQINTNISVNGDQQLKMSREGQLNEEEESKKSNHKHQHSNVRLVTDLKVDSKDKQISIAPEIKANEKSDTNDGTFKLKEKPE